MNNGHWIPPQPHFPIAISQCNHDRRYVPTQADSRPQDLFNFLPDTPRLVHLNDPSQILILAHGVPGKRPKKKSCGTPGGIGIYFSRDENVAEELLTHPSMVGRITCTGNAMSHTYQSAQLEAAIRGLGLRDWKGEGWKRVVIASSWPFVVNAISGKALDWEKNGWKNGSGEEVKHRAIWGELMGLLEKLGNEGVAVKFWDIRRKDNPAVGLAGEGRIQQKIIKRKEREEKWRARMNQERDASPQQLARDEMRQRRRWLLRRKK